MSAGTVSPVTDDRPPHGRPPYGRTARSPRMLGILLVLLAIAAVCARLGVWQAETQPPWAFREDRWGRAVAEAPGGCPIKGNINRDGERIYHTPWSPWYGRTQIDEAHGERWFCDEAEAVAAGWRAARGR